MNQEIKIKISPTVGGIERHVHWNGFSYWYHERQEAEMLCTVVLMQNDERVQNPDLVQDRTVRIEISNRNRVTQEGVLIPPPSEENDTSEAWATGIPEYDFYFGSFMMNQEMTSLQVIMYALSQLALHGRFDRI
jgi:hypothetical protein